MTTHEKFLTGIREKKVVELDFNSNEKGRIKRLCIPFDFGPSRRNLAVNPGRYHFYDLDSPDGEHTLSILPEQINSIDIKENVFDPADYVTWSPIEWFIARDWGIYS